MSEKNIQKKYKFFSAEAQCNGKLFDPKEIVPDDVASKEELYELFDFYQIDATTVCNTADDHKKFKNFWDINDCPDKFFKLFLSVDGVEKAIQDSIMEIHDPNLPCGDDKYFEKLFATNSIQNVINKTYKRCGTGKIGIMNFIRNYVMMCLYSIYVRNIDKLRTIFGKYYDVIIADTDGADFV